MAHPVVHSMYWHNIPDTILEKQCAVFKHLQIELVQEAADKKSHGVWMNEVLERSASDEVVVFCDIDAFPLNQSAYAEAIRQAENGAVFGLAQFSNHKKGEDLYAGPMFMAIRKSTWQALGSPSLRSDREHDAAEVLSVRARERQIPLVMIRPSGCLIPKWALGDQGVFGIGTFYGDCDFFHLFESRKPAYERILREVADDVTAARPLNFRHYLEIVEQLEQDARTPPKSSGSFKLWKIFSR